MIEEHGFNKSLHAAEQRFKERQQAEARFNFIFDQIYIETKNFFDNLPNYFGQLWTDTKS